MAGQKDQSLQPLGFQQIAAPASSTALTVPAGARFAMFNVSGTQSVVFRDDGVAPTATVGIILTTGTNYWYTGKLSAVRVIQAAASGNLNVAYYA
jgi:hypothetical protein